MFGWLFGKKPGPEAVVEALPGAMLRTVVDANAPDFGPAEDLPDDELESSGGREAAAWLTEALQERGLQPSPVEPWEGYGQYFELLYEGRRIRVIAQGICSLIMEDKTRGAQPGPPDQTALAHFCVLIHEILTGDPRVSEVEWYRFHDHGRGGALDHPLAEFRLARQNTAPPGTRTRDPATPRVRTLVEAHADMFDPVDIDEKDDAAVMAAGGREASKFLVLALRSRGIKLTKIKRWETYGHQFAALFEGREIWVLAQANCILSIEDRRAPTAIFNRESTLARFVTLIDQILRADDRIGDVEWYRAKEAGERGPSAGPLSEFAAAGASVP